MRFEGMVFAKKTQAIAGVSFSMPATFDVRGVCRVFA